jgi:hypothetical protein
MLDETLADRRMRAETDHDRSRNLPDFSQSPDFAITTYNGGVEDESVTVA